ncbi:MAG: hypothetical protein M3373_03655 [Gemmatimonadota bacterium]|nr:hypothetical protein [Gemmatimonadota bacterium]
MPRNRTFGLMLVAGLALGAAAFTHAPVVGPPWISIEYPPSPYDRTTRDAYLLVHAFHHGTPANFPVSGTAEGLVRGERRSVKLAFGTTSRTGTYAVRKQWPDDGTWTLLVTVAQGKDDGATAVVDIGSNGGVAAVRVPTRRQGEWLIPQRVSMQEVDASLRARAAGALAGR